MNVEMIRKSFGKRQITIHAMSWCEFVYFMESLDFARYEGFVHER